MITIVQSVDDSTNLYIIFLLFFNFYLLGLQHIYEAENGLDSYELVKKHHEDNDDFNFIITDNQMPVMDGITSVTKIREIGYQHKIIMITGDCLVQDQTNMLNCGVNHILLKPIEKDKMFALLNL